MPAPVSVMVARHIVAASQHLAVAHKLATSRQDDRMAEHIKPAPTLPLSLDTAQVQTAKQAAALADAYEKGQGEWIASLRESQPVATLFDQVAPLLWKSDLGVEHKNRLARSFGPDGLAAVDQAMIILLGIESLKVWQRNRVVYRVHPNLAASLADTEPGAAIPCEVFTRLPHPDPFVAFPTPIPAPHGADSSGMAKPAVYVGMLVTGLSRGLTLCSTSDPDLCLLNVALVGRVHYIGKTQPEYREYSIRIPCLGDRYTVDEMVETAGQMIATTDPEARENGAQRNAFRLAVSLLLYLCSGRSDIGARTELTPGKKKRRQRLVPNTVVDVGFDIGPKLHAASRDASATSSGESGSRVRAHIRKAHWHTYWTGPKEQRVAEVRWLHPILVNAADRDPSRFVVIDVDSPSGQ
ncbi:hypothetical protein [Nocardia sp. bgisy134]|uniref:hypothetical protein n=1 Tax=Nocardia sp. bgisy134 TaxID=3413789 RepID=UPI003D72CB16